MECGIESSKEMYEFESISYYLCFNFDEVYRNKHVWLKHTQPKDKTIETLCLCVKLRDISQCLLVADCKRTTAGREILLTLRICSLCPP